MFIKYKLEVQIQTNSAFLEEEIYLLEEKVVDQLFKTILSTIGDNLIAFQALITRGLCWKL